MPKVIAMCLRTTSLVVRCAALGLMAQAVARLDKDAATAMLQVSGQVRSGRQSWPGCISYIRMITTAQSLQLEVASGTHCHGSL